MNLPLYKLSNIEEVKARKKYECFICKTSINVGDLYFRVKSYTGFIIYAQFIKIPSEVALCKNCINDVNDIQKIETKIKEYSLNRTKDILMEVINTINNTFNEVEQIQNSKEVKE